MAPGKASAHQRGEGLVVADSCRTSNSGLVMFLVLGEKYERHPFSLSPYVSMYLVVVVGAGDKWTRRGTRGKLLCLRDTSRRTGEP